MGRKGTNSLSNKGLNVDWPRWTGPENLRHEGQYGTHGLVLAQFLWHSQGEGIRGDEPFPPRCCSSGVRPNSPFEFEKANCPENSEPRTSALAAAHGKIGKK
jgi:hypothetical protein